MKRLTLFTIITLLLASTMPARPIEKDAPLRLAIAGLSHGHLGEVAKRIDRGDFIIVGVYEADAAVRENNILRGKVDAKLFFPSLKDMLEKTKPEAVAAYGSVFDHLSVVEACAPMGISVMVEKPLAVSLVHAQRMAELARKHNILLLTNYETAWYPANQAAFQMIKEGKIGEITRINTFNGHEGPVEVGCTPEFLSWLTDPVGNGGGAVMDFGCYGANLTVHLLWNKEIDHVHGALLRQKPDVYTKVDDDATILIQYPGATSVIMASWNWPTGRREMHVYGTKGYILQDSPTSMRVCEIVDKTPRVHSITLPPLSPPCDDAFHYLKAAVRKEITPLPEDLPSLENNLIVAKILDAAKE